MQTANRIREFKDAKKQLLKELSRRWLSTIFFAGLLVATIFTINEESDIPLHAADDYSIVILCIIALVIILAKRNDNKVEDLRRLNAILFIITIILLAFMALAFFEEINDPSDFANEPGQLIFLIFLAINRFT